MKISFYILIIITDSDHDDNSSNPTASHSSSSAGGTISDGEGGDDQLGVRIRQHAMENYWDMSNEQEKYYTEQFHLLLPDHHGLVNAYFIIAQKHNIIILLTMSHANFQFNFQVNGAVAKGFFEKSKLPHTELREIWQLADITRDGCLDLNEFKMAMHLVVLRRHNLPIPSHFYNRPPDFALTAGNSLYQPSKKLNTNKSSPKTSIGTTSATQHVPVVSTSATLVAHDKASSYQSKRPSKGNKY